MTHHDHSQERREGGGRFLTSRSGIIFLVFLFMAGVLLFSEHRVHALGYLPFLFLLACPLLHVFGHGSHGGAHHQQKDPGVRGRTGSSETRNKAEGDKP